LRGKAGVKSVLVNSLGYRQSEEIWTPAEPGRNVVLTLDLDVQQAGEAALRTLGSDTRGAVVVLDPHTGDVLALASAPAYDPNAFIPQISPQEFARLSDPTLRPQINRATQENYQPGSISKS
jgi:penicillin-binding protein 2